MSSTGRDRCGARRLGRRPRALVGAVGAAPWLLIYKIYVIFETTEDTECTEHFCISLCSSVHSVVNIEMIPAPIRSFTLPPPGISTCLCPMLCMRASLEAGKNVDMAVISKVHPLRSHSGAAQGRHGCGCWMAGTRKLMKVL